MRFSIFLFLIISELSLLGHACAAGFTRPKILQIEVVEGISPVAENNFAKAKAEATRDGLKNAVKRAITDIVGEIPEESADMIDFLVESNFEKYIQGYTILTEIVEDAFFMNLMSVDLFAAELKGDLLDLDLSPIAESAPVLLVLIDERVSSVYSEENFLTLFAISEDAILKGMKQKGWDASGRERVSEIADLEEIRDAINGNLEAALLTGKKLEADFLLLGTAIRANEESLAGENQFIEVDYHIVSMEKGEVIGNGKASGNSNSNDSFLATAQALRHAGGKLSDHFHSLLAKELEKEPPEEAAW